MAFFGDLGRFLNIETSEAAAIGSQLATGNIGGAVLSGVKAVATPIPSGSAQPADVSAPPAGVDSTATLSRVSQTSMLGGPTGDGPGVLGGGSGMRQNQAFIGGFGLPSIVGGATRLLSRPGVGGLVGGLGAGAVVDFFIDQFGQQKKLVITRKMQRDVKKLFMMSGGDFNMTAELYRMATGRSISGEQVVKIITKTFKNQGPFVTKAAVRKTRSTIRKMETLCDLKDRLCPPKRAAPRRRTMGSTTKVLQVK